jgi:hypothetical protein
MNTRIRIEINGRDEFWGKAVLVEWEDQYPERRLDAEPGDRYFLIETEWFEDLKRVAGDCFSEVIVAPVNPDRRLWLSRFIPSGKERKA